jgi:hypothetical protein
MQRGSDRRERSEISPGLLFVDLIGLRVMGETGARILRRRAQALVRFGDERPNRKVLRPREIGDARANGGSGVVREEHRRQEHGQEPHPPESHVISLFARRGTAIAGRLAVAARLMNSEKMRFMQIKCRPFQRSPAGHFGLGQGSGHGFVAQRNTPTWRYRSVQQDNMGHTFA